MTLKRALTVYGNDAYNKLKQSLDIEGMTYNVRCDKGFYTFAEL